MRNALRLFLALGAASTLGAGLLLACSDDTSVDASTEAGTDARSDAPDFPDGGKDTAPPFDGGFVLDTFDTVLATELCHSLARCCYGSPTPPDGGADGGSFDLGMCVKNLVGVGFQGSQLGVELKDAGNVVLDQVSADDCIKKIKAIQCDLPGPDYTATRTACFGAYSGKFAANQACKGSVECQSGLFCKGQVDGGAGVCTAIRGVGGPCGDNPNSDTEYEEACSYRAGGGTGNYCRWYNVAGAGSNLDAGDWKCTPASAIGEGCVSSTWCKDSICEPAANNTCKTPDRIFDTACTTFVK